MKQILQRLDAKESRVERAEMLRNACAPLAATVADIARDHGCKPRTVYRMVQVLLDANGTLDAT